MLTHENLIVFLYALPAYQLLFFTVQLITFKKAFPSRKYLGLLLLNMSIVLVLNIIHHLGYTHLMATLHIFFSPLLLNILPVFFLYLYSLTSENHEVKGSSRFILFIFPVLGLLLNVFTFGFLPFHERFLMIAGKDPAVGEMVTGIFQVARVIGIWSGPILFAVQWIVAFLLGRSLVKSQKQARQADPGHSAYLQPLWMKVVAISVILFILAIFIPLILHSGSQMEWTIISNILLLLSGGMTGYYGMK